MRAEAEKRYNEIDELLEKLETHLDDCDLMDITTDERDRMQDVNEELQRLTEKTSNQLAEMDDNLDLAAEEGGGDDTETEAENK